MVLALRMPRMEILHNTSLIWLPTVIEVHVDDQPR